MRVRFRNILLDPTPPPEGGTGNQPDYAAALAKHNGDASAMAMAQFNEASNLRRQLADATARVPKEGSRVLSADEASRFDAWQSLGKPEDVRKAIDQGKADATELAVHRREATVRDAARALGWKPEVLSKLVAADGLALEVGQERREGKDVPAAWIVRKGADGKDEKVALDDKYAEGHWPDFAVPLKHSPPNRNPATASFASGHNRSAEGHPAIKVDRTRNTW